MHDHPEFELRCLFCGRDPGHEHIMVGAFWDEGHGIGQEHWPAHAACLLERMGAHARAAGGPFLEAMAAREGT